MTLLAAERRQIILEKLQAEKKVIVSQLSDLFSVSDETIRRDLEQLCQAGHAVKSYGGAIINENGFNIRKTQQPNEKKIIAEIIETLVKDGDSIMLDASTTAVYAAKMLKNKERLQVITNSMEVMLELADKPDWTVIATGGRLIGDYLAFAGNRTIQEVLSFHVDKLIFSCKGLVYEKGIFESNDDFSQVKKAMLSTAKVKILAVDSSKFDKTAFSKVADIEYVDIVVTDSAPSQDWLEYFKAQKVKCLFCQTSTDQQPGS